MLATFDFLVVSFFKIIARTTPVIVVTSPDSIVGKIINEGFVEPLVVIKLITVVGRIWIPEEANIIVIIIGKFTFPDLSSSSSIALIPSGTEAPPIPSKLVERESDKYSFAFGEMSFPQSRLIRGFSSLDKPLLRAVFSTIFIIPSQTAYIANNSKDNSSALVLPSKKAGRVKLGEEAHKKIKLIKMSSFQIKFMLNYIN